MYAVDGGRHYVESDKISTCDIVFNYKSCNLNCQLFTFCYLH